MAEAGWYPDPQDARSLQYFDGQNWTGDRRPAADVPSNDAAIDQTTRLSDLKSGAGWPAQDPQQGAQQPPSSQSWAAQPTQQQPAQSPAQPAWQATPPGPQYPQQQYGTQPPAQGAPGAGWAGGTPPGGTWQTPPAKAKRKRTPLIIAAVVVVVVAVGAFFGIKAFTGDDAPSITYQGKEIASSQQFLDKTETAVDQVVTKRHGVKSGDTRCYFVQPDTAASGAKKSDVADTLRCGPVLFVDGNKDQTYLPVPFTSQDSNGKVELTASDSLDNIEPAAIDEGVKLVRPDGQTPADGSGGLQVPEPPAADKNALVSTSLGSVNPPSSLSDSSIIGKGTKVTLTAAGVVARYGKGDDARSAPSGEELIAFQLEYGSGDIDGSGSARAQLVVDGGSPRTLPEASGSDTWIVAAVPKSSSPALQLTEDGFTQSLSLPDGKPGSDNIAVLSRTHRTGYVGKTIKIPMKIAQGGRSAPITFTATAALASLDFWIPGHENRHASAADKAILSVKLNYTDSANPGQTYGFDPELLQLKLPSGDTIPARNVAAANKIFDVFEVPADFTRGYLVVTGSEKVSGYTLSVRTPKQFPIGILAN